MIAHLDRKEKKKLPIAAINVEKNMLTPCAIIIGRFAKSMHTVSTARPNAVAKP